jgi:CRP-like cAMP-binding protein
MSIDAHPLRLDAVQAPVFLAAGALLFEADTSGCVWQLETGALRLDRVGREGPRFMQLVLPGDLMGLELLAAYPYTYSARAIVRSTARRHIAVGESDRRVTLVEGLMQQQRRGEDLVILRSGSAQDRLKHLLLLLAPDDNAWLGENPHCPLPTIKDMAAIIDTAPETVSRIFGHLKRNRLLEGRQRQGASFRPSHLRDSEWPSGMTRGKSPVPTPEESAA